MFWNSSFIEQTSRQGTIFSSDLKYFNHLSSIGSMFRAHNFPRAILAEGINRLENWHGMRECYQMLFHWQQIYYY